jgi:class 3 adenylate cyclase
MPYISIGLGRLRREVDALLDALAWSAARGTVDAVRYQPRQLALTIACAANQPEVPQPVRQWLAGPPLLLKSSAVVHTVLRAAAGQSALWVGPTASAVVRWLADAMAGAADRVSAATIERPLGGRAHPGMLVPHVHEVAILAVDMRGFSNLTRALHDSGYLVDLIEDYLARLTRVVEQHRGVVFQYTGDGLLALFLPELVGVGSAAMMERLAGSLGAQLHEVFDRAHDRWRRDWAARGLDVADVGLGAGLSFGRATVGIMGPPGKKQVGVIGEPVNLAAFLCSQAPAGALLVDVDSFPRAGATPPSAAVMRLRSKKRHQRIRTFRLDFGRHVGRRPWRWMRDGLPSVDLRWGWPPVELA